MKGTDKRVTSFCGSLKLLRPCQAYVRRALQGRGACQYFTALPDNIATCCWRRDSALEFDVTGSGSCAVFEDLTDTVTPA